MTLTSRLSGKGVDTITPVDPGAIVTPTALTVVPLSCPHSKPRLASKAKPGVWLTRVPRNRGWARSVLGENAVAALALLV